MTLLTSKHASCFTPVQLLLVMGVLEHASVFLLLCWVLVVPLMLGLTRAADVARKRWLLPVPSKQLPWIAAAAAGLGEWLSWHCHGVAARWAQPLWQQR